jgi:hypothetical protein
VEMKKKTKTQAGLEMGELYDELKNSHIFRPYKASTVMAACSAVTTVLAIKCMTKEQFLENMAYGWDTIEADLKMLDTIQ